MVNNETISKVVYEIEKYIKNEKYKGYDPFDVLNAPFFNLPVLKSNKFIRFVSQQIFRRIPFNLRPILLITKGINPVTLGLVIQAYSYLAQAYPAKKRYYLYEIEYCLNKLIELRSSNYSGCCWGYNFDWEARYAEINAYVPTVVATGIITNSLYEYYKLFNDGRIVEILDSAALFVLHDLNRTYEKDTFCFSYSPLDNQQVYNATMKAARLLAQAYSVTGKEQYINEAEKTVRFVINNQRDDGAWAYSKGDARTWIDNFHTAYVLDGLDAFIKLSDKKEYTTYLQKGLKFYLDNLFTIEGLPKYYSHSFYPIDATEVAQSIITLINFGELNRAKITINFALKKLYSGDGYFYYQQYKYFTNKIPYMRWSTVWMFLALSFYLFKTAKNNMV